MQTQKPARESGDSGPAVDDGAGDAIALTAAPGGEPLITGPAAVLWTGFAGAAFVFLLVFVLLLRGRAAPAGSRNTRHEQRSKTGKQWKAGQGAEFFQPAGEGAEITFENDAAPVSTRAPDQGGGRKERAPIDTLEAEVVIEGGMANRATAPRPGSFSGLFGRRKQEQLAAPAADEAENEAGAPEAPPAPALNPSATAEALPETEFVDVTTEQEDVALGAPEPDVEELRASLADAERARVTAERKRAHAEEARRAEDKAAIDRRAYENALQNQERAGAGEPASLEPENDGPQRFHSEEVDDRFASLADRLEARFLSSRTGADDGEPEADDRRLAVSEMISERMAEQRETINAALAAMSERIDRITGAPADVTSLREEMQTIKHALADRTSGPTAPLVQLSDIVKNALPPTAYEMRAILANNRRADCLVRLPHPPGPIAIDARFPVEAFDRLRAASGENAERAANEFRRTALRHIVDIAERLIVPEETAESALMFIPSESMYAALHAQFPDIVQDSYRARVWIVSPTTLMATLHTIRAVLRDAQARESAELIHSEAQHILAEVDALRRRVIALEDNFEKARHDVRDVISSTDQVYRRAETITNTRRTLAEDSLGRGSKRLPAAREGNWSEDERRDPADDDDPDDGDPRSFPLR